MRSTAGAQKRGERRKGRDRTSAAVGESFPTPVKSMPPPAGFKQSSSNLQTKELPCNTGKTSPVIPVKSQDGGESCKATRRGPLAGTRRHGPASPCCSPLGTTKNPADNPQENPQRAGKVDNDPRLDGHSNSETYHLPPSKGGAGLGLPDPRPGNKASQAGSFLRHRGGRRVPPTSQAILAEPARGRKGAPRTGSPNTHLHQAPNLEAPLPPHQAGDTPSSACTRGAQRWAPTTTSSRGHTLRGVG